MKSCTVVLEESLSPEDMVYLVRAIQQLKGVVKVEGFPDGNAQPSPPTGEAAPNFEDVNSQRLFLQKAIQWGIQNGQLTVGELSSLSAEQTVQKAMEFIDKMTTNEKQSLTNEVARRSK